VPTTTTTEGGVMENGLIVAAWASKGGAHGVTLRRTAVGGYCYRANGAGGTVPAISDAEAKLYMVAPAWPSGPRRVDLHQPDANKTPMARIQ